ncbi:MAG: hypothetical protein RBS56_01415 [Candidatus Gracilibacteria bacterium]|jgi:hypothetical protein|nr:hypothetical protein [Candidatus Gracilibacteria bacterium]
MKKILLFALSLTLFSLLGSQVVFAEDDVECSGRIKGETVVDPSKANFNGGVTSFNDAGDLKLVDLSVMLGAGAMGYAPSRESAACIIADEDEPFMSLGADEFGVKGFAWNTNVGFVSMYCDGAAAPYSNLGYSCGNFKYGVKVGAEAASGAPAGARPLLGYAYNDVLGYINFSCFGGVDVYGNACGGIDYGVFRDSSGNLSGYGYTSAGIYLVFDGVNMGLPDELVVEDSWCDGKPYVCLEILPDPLSLDYNLTDGYKLADGQDFYEVHVYLKDKNGNYDPALYDEKTFFQSLNFSWVDRLKLNQLAGQSVGDSLNDKSEPYRERVGGVVYKPVSGLDQDAFTHDGTGHFVLKNKISSFAPSSDGNVSKTSSLTPPILVKNERFLYNYPKVSGGIEENVLKLMNLTFNLLDDKTGLPIPGVPGVVYPNGQEGLALKFKPVWDLTTLYVNNLQDKIVGYRGIPVSFTLKATLSGKESFVNPSVDFLLDYDKNMTELSPLCSSKVPAFDFHFLKDVEGKDLECLELSDPKDPSSPCKKYQGDLLKQSLISLKDRQIMLPAIATVFVEGEDVPCDMVQGPGFISVVTYETGDGQTVSYYGNKIPKLGGGVISNPAALIRGNVYAQTTFTPSAQTESGQVLSTVNLDIVQDTVKENLAKAFLNKKLPQGSGNICRVLAFDKTKIHDCIEGQDYGVFEVNQEQAFYFKDSDVVFDTDVQWDGLKVLIVDGGNVYINGNLYNSDLTDQRLSLVVLRGYDKAYGEAGNIYIAPNVQNIQANIAASGSVFSYNGDKNKINATTGEPIWADDQERISSLGRQIFIQGSISSRNTIGGADLDAPRSGSFAKAKNYLLLGTGEILQNPSGEDRIRAQLYDLNYLRLFRMIIETTPEGLPVDQKCDKGLTPDDIMTISSGGQVLFNGEECNGIDPLNAFPPGDLVAPDDPSLYAQGVPIGEKNSPVYIFYMAPSKDSFVFSKPGALNIGR